MKVVPSERARHLVLQSDAGEILPQALSDAMREHRVAWGWLSGAGILVDVELRSVNAESGNMMSRRIEGSMQLVSLEGSISLEGGAPMVVMHGVLAREGEGGVEVLAGEIERARVVSFGAFATVFGDASAPVANWNEAIRATSEAETRRQANPTAPTAIPKKPGFRRSEEDEIYPEAGAIVDHFTFGRCEVVKSDGERLHLRVDKGGKVKEIALSVLLVTPLPDEGGVKRFKLDRKVSP